MSKKNCSQAKTGIKFGKIIHRMAMRFLISVLLVLAAMDIAVAGQTSDPSANHGGDQEAYPWSEQGNNGHHYGYFKNGPGHNDGSPGENGKGNNDDDRCYNGNGNANGQTPCDDNDNVNCNPGNRHCDIQDNLSISKLSGLRFPSVVSGYSQMVTVSPADPGAAVFTVRGEPCMRIRVEVVQSAGLMLANGSSSTDTIGIRDFTLGGGVSASGTGFLDCSTGELGNIRVGGTAEVGPSNKESFYRGFLNLRAWYY